MKAEEEIKGFLQRFSDFLPPPLILESEQRRGFGAGKGGKEKETRIQIQDAMCLN